MDTASVADTSEAAQAVTDDGAGRSEIAGRQGLDFGMAKAPDATQLQADRLALWGGFLPPPRTASPACAGAGFARRTAPALAAVPLAAEIGIVDFDPSGAFPRPAPSSPAS